uniref:Condensin complex subunit 1 C-terminal domain-containing protein n=1 Tax=Globodera rostochiensis TaxID=31243 RepID=A0A914HPD6_GLORO
MRRARSYIVPKRMAETAATVAPFVIPQRDDDLLQCSNTIYYVGELIQDEDEIRDAVKMFRRGVLQGDFEHIATHFDHFFPLVRTADGGSAGITFDARHRVELAELLIDGLENLISTLQMHICDIATAGTATGHGNNNNAVEDITGAGLNRRYSNCLLMHVYLLSALTNHFEQHMNKITRSAAAENVGCGRGKRRVVHVEAEDDQIVQCWHKQDKRGKLVKVMYKLISLSVSTEDNEQFWRVDGGGDDAPTSAIRFLWTSRQIDDSLKICVLSMVCKFLENPDVCKAIGRTILYNMFMLLRHICIYWNMHKAVARALMDLAPRLDYFQSAQPTTFPFVDGIFSVQTDDEFEPLLREMIAYGSKLDTAVDSGGGTGGGRTTEAATRAFAFFISTTVEKKPELMHKHLAFIMPFVDNDPPILRNAVLFVCSEILLRCFDCKELDQTMRDQRDMLFAHLTDHMMDKSALVRTRVLNLWAKLASNPGAIPPVQLRLGLLWEARGRLNDDSMMVRKAAATLLTKLIRFNQFGADLHFDTFFVQFMNVRRRFATLWPTAAAANGAGGGDDGAGDGGAYAFEDAYAAVGDEQLLIEEDRADVQAVQRDRVRMELDQQLNALLFITEMEKALKQALEYIRQAQAQQLEIAELLHFVGECVKFRLRDSMHALKRAFNLIWRKDPNIVELVTDMAHEALFSKNEKTLIAQQRTAQNLVEAMRRATDEERISLEETVAQVFTKYGVHPKVLDEFWTYFDSADTELRLSAARLIVVVAKAKHRLILPQLDRLYELYRNRTEHIRIEMLRVLMTLAAATKQTAQDGNTGVLDTEQPSFRLDPKDKFVKLMSTFVFTELNSQDAKLWVPHCRQVVNVIYGACHRPNRVFKDLYDSMVGKTKKCLDELRPQMHADDASDQQQQQQSPTLGSQVEEMTTTTSPAANNECRRAELELVISRLLFFVGELVLKFLSYAESSFSVHIRDTILRQGRKSATATPNRPPSHHSVREKNAENGGDGGGEENGHDADDDGLGQEISEEEKNQMCLQRVLDKDTFAQDTIIGRTMPVLMAVLENHINWSNVVVESALLCLSKFMLVNARCCKTFLPSFFSFFDAASVRMRNNMIIMMTDLSFRFPNVFNTFNDVFIQKVRDENTGVRYTCLLMCMHLLLKDQIKINACVADMACCLLPDMNPSHIVTTAHGLFCEMGKKHNALYNNLPAIIDKLLADVDVSEQEDGEARVQQILQFLLQWVDNDQQKREKLVDKLVERHGDRVVGWRCVAQVLKAKEAALELQQQQLQQQPPQQQQQQQGAPKAGGGGRAAGGKGRGAAGRTPRR